MIMSNVGRIVIASSLYAISHTAGYSFIKIEAQFTSTNSDLYTCHTCLLQEVGATRLVLTHIRKECQGRRCKAFHMFSVAASEFFYANVVSFCARPKKCGIMSIIEGTAPELKPSVFADKLQAQYMCLLKTKKAQRVTCRNCLKQSSHSDLVGDFIMNHPIYYLALHMYVLYTTERDDTIVNGCMSKTFCSGFTGVLEAETCSLFVESLPVKDRELLPKSNSLKQPTKHIYEKRISRADEYLKLMKSLLQKGMDRHCLRTEKVSNTTATCSACIAKQLNAQIFNMGEQFENNNHESTAMEKPWLRYVYYIYTYTGINWNQLHSFCIQSCGVIKSEEDERNCLTPLNDHFDSSTRDLPIRTQSMSASSSVKPTFCIWIKMIMTETENQKPEICSTTSTNSKTIMELSEATYLLWTSDLTVLTCIGHSTQRLAITHEVPIAICEYEERVENPQETKRLQASGFDLNKKPRSELILAIPPRVRKQHNDDDDQTVRIQYDPSFHNVIKVIHLKNTAKDMILTCIICLCQYEEVLLVSVTQSYLWLTTKAEGTISGLSECKNKCSIDTSFPQHVNYLDDFQSLQPLSVDEVVSMYGEKGKDYSKLWRKSSDDVSIEMLDRIIEIE